MINKIKNNKRNYITALCICTIFTILFFRNFNLSISGYSKHVMLGFVIGALLVILIPVLFVCINSWNDFLNNRFINIVNIKKYIVNNKKRFAIRVLLFALGGPGVIFFIRYITPNQYVGYTLCAVIYVIIFVFIYSKKSGTKPEGLFACIAIVIGCFAIMVTPAVPGISTDDEIHYRRTLSIANFCSDINYVAEKSSMDRYAEVILDKYAYTKETRDKYYSELNISYINQQVVDTRFEENGLHVIAYIPGAIGIIIGKGLGLSFVNIFRLGKVFSLLAYVTVMYYAIRRLKYGKILFATMGLIPSNIFLASNYSYDTWVFSFFALGFSYYFSILQNNEKIKNREIVFMSLFFLLGAMPKAIYIVLTFPVFYMPRDKFNNNRQRFFYYCSFIIMAILLIASMVVPRFFAKTYAGDMRGGSDVNIGGQVEFIFGNLIGYLKILFEFLRQYLALENARSVYQFYAYLGSGKEFVFIIIMLVLVAFLDRGQEKKRLLPMKIMAVIAVIGCAMIIATGLYIDFTPVGHNTINGCQPRYILPLIIPFLYCIVPEGIDIGIKKNWLANITMTLFSLSFIYNIYLLSVKLYLPV